MAERNYEDEIASLLTDESGSYVNFVKLTKKVYECFIVKAIRTLNAERRLFIADFYDLSAKIWVPMEFFCPSALETRLFNLDLIDNDNKSESVILIKYLGEKMSNKNRKMHSFFVKV